MPTTPHSAAGCRIDPPVSVARAIIASPAATAHAQHVFDRDRDAAKRSGVALPDLAVSFVRLLFPELLGETQVSLHARVEPLDALHVSRHEVRRRDRAEAQQARRLLDGQARQLVGHVSSWIDGTRKNPSTAAGALATASSWLRHGRGSSSRNRLSTSTTCAVGGMSSVSSCCSLSMCRRMPLSWSA